MTMHVLINLSEQLTSYKFLFIDACVVVSIHALVNQGQYGHLVCHHQKGKFVESILIGYSVLMITNLNDDYT